MNRIVQPEILDTLAENDPEALKIRRDIKLFNILMGNFRWFERELPKVLLRGDSLLEIGAGHGDLGRHLHKTVLANSTCQLDGLDLCSRPLDWPANWNWHREDIRTFDRYDEYEVILANFVLHQFEDSVLRDLGRRCCKTRRVILACETARRKFHLHQLKLAKCLGMSKASVHDAKASIESGFVAEELPSLLGLEPTEWTWLCQTGFLDQYRMIAVRSDKH